MEEQAGSSNSSYEDDIEDEESLKAEESGEEEEEEEAEEQPMEREVPLYGSQMERVRLLYSSIIEGKGPERCGGKDILIGMGEVAKSMVTGMILQ